MQTNIVSANFYPQYLDRNYYGRYENNQSIFRLVNKDRTDVFCKSDNSTKTDCSDGSDDGKISFGEKLKSFAKGIVSPITSMFKSPKNFIKGALMIAGCAALCVATGGAATPFLVAGGVAMGGFQVVKGAVKAHNAKTDGEAKAAWEEIGGGTATVALSVAGAKAAAKSAAAAGVKGFEGAQSMTALQATKACITNAGKSFSASVNTFKSGQAFTNLSNAFAPKKAALKETTKKTECLEEGKTKAIEAKPNEAAGLKNPTEEYVADLRRRIDSGEISFADKEKALQAYEQLIKDGYDPNKLFRQMKINGDQYSELLTHDTKFQSLSAKKGLDGCHTQEFKNSIIDAANKGKGEFVQIDDVISHFAENPNNAPSARIKLIPETYPPQYEMQLTARGTTNTNTVTITETSPNTIEILRTGGKVQTKTFALESDIQSVLGRLRDGGIEGCAGKLPASTNPGQFGTSCVVSSNGSYYFVQVNGQTGGITSCFPITSDAVTQRGFILDLVPFLK